MRVPAPRPGWPAVAVALAGLIAVLVLLFPAGPRHEKPPENPGVEAPPPSRRPTPDAGSRDEANPQPGAQEGRGPGRVVVRGIVREPDGRPAGADTVVEVFSEGPARPLASGTCGGKGFFRIRLDPSEASMICFVRARRRDGSALAESHPFVARAGGRGVFLALRLQEGMRIAGCVVDESGEPAPGARVRISLKVGGNARETEAVADESGRFSVVAFRRRGRVAARQPGGVFGVPRDFRPAESGPTDVGTVVVPETRVVVWTLRFLSETGEIVRNVHLQCGADDFWNLREHPDYEGDIHAVRTDERGVARLAFPCRETPALLAAGGGDHDYGVRIFALDCRLPGRREATIRLKRNPAIVVRLLVEGIEELRTLGMEVGIDPSSPLPHERPHFPPPRWCTAEEAGSGKPVRIPLRGRFPPSFMLDQNLFRRSGRWVEAGVWRTHVPGAGTYVASLVIEEGDLCRRNVVVREGETTVYVDLPVPPGRRVALDGRDLEDGVRKAGGAPWLGRYSAWAVPSPRPGTTPAVREVHGGAHRPVFLMEDEDARVTQRKWIRLPAGVEVVAFGFLVDASSSGSVAAPETEVVLRRVTEGAGGPRVRVPAPVRCGSAARVVVQVTVGGRPFPHEGIPVNVRLRSFPPGTPGPGPAGCALDIVTGPDGRAVVRLFPGRYEMMVSNFLQGPAVELVVRHSDRDLKVDVPLEMP